MSKLMQSSMILVAASLLAFGCGSSSKTKTDGGTNDKGGTIKIPDGGGGNTDSGVTPGREGGVVPGDQGTPQQLSCIQIVQCVSKCGADQTCATQCISQGTTEAKAQIQALAQCIDTAVKGACAAPCADPQSKACQDCVLPACKAEQDACAGTGGPATDGFGDACDPAAATACKTGLECKPTTDPAKGFCTKACTNAGETCPGAAAGQLAACVLGYDGDPNTYCAFLCQLKDNTGGTQSFTCPSTLTCSATDDPPGSGQKGCDP